MNLNQLRTFIIRPTLNRISLWCPASENLVVGTGLVESDNFRFVDQVTNADLKGQTTLGPAVGFYQMERGTLDWLLQAFGARVAPLKAPWPSSFEQLATNIAFATAMCRFRYYVDPQPLPAADDIEGLAAYWKRVYNTVHGKGRPEEFVRRYREAHK